MNVSWNEGYELIARTLVGEGFHLKSGMRPCFEGKMNVEGIDFHLRISRIDPKFEELPEVHLLHRPENLPALLPHLEPNNKLCYLDRLGQFLDPFYPARTMLVLLGHVRSTLEIIVNPDQSQNDFAGEFQSYWPSKLHGFLTSNNKRCISHFYDRVALDGTVSKELVVGASSSEINHWCRIRNGKESLSPRFESNAIVLQMDEALCYELEKIWPPKNMADFLGWTKSLSSSVEAQLLRALLPVTKECVSAVIILQSEKSGSFGVSLLFSSNLRKSVEKFRSNANKVLPGKHLDQFRTIVSNKLMVKNFYRLQVSDVTEKYIYERNLTTSSLRNYKIALIGCGTIGSQAAALLQKAGAGSGSKGQFDLFDRDILKEGNLGRHLLGAEYLMESKSHAVADFLLKNSSSQLNINAAIGVKVKNLSLLKHYDVVIDATGEETFSCLLASYLSDLRRDDQKLPIVLHTWIDAGGYAVRSLLDDGSGACYRCLKIQKNGADTGALVERYPLFNSVDKEEDMIVVTQRCGESYIPFSAGISSAAAGLVQQMVLEAVSENAGFKFRHQSHASFVKRTQDQNPKKSVNCPCCSPRLI